MCLSWARFSIVVHGIDFISIKNKFLLSLIKFYLENEISDIYFERPVDTWRRFNINATSYNVVRRRTCVYGERPSLKFNISVASKEDFCKEYFGIFHLPEILKVFRSSCLEVFCKKDILKISPNSQGNICEFSESFFFWHRLFPVNCVIFFRTYFL